MRDIITSILDALGLLMLSAGVAAAVFPLVGWSCLIAAGVVVLAGSAFAAWQSRPPDRAGRR